jgi:hypothetical protein
MTRIERLLTAFHDLRKTHRYVNFRMVSRRSGMSRAEVSAAVISASRAGIRIRFCPIMSRDSITALDFIRECNAAGEYPSSAEIKSWLGITRHVLWRLSNADHLRCISGQWHYRSHPPVVDNITPAAAVEIMTSHRETIRDRLCEAVEERRIADIMTVYEVLGTTPQSMADIKAKTGLNQERCRVALRTMKTRTKFAAPSVLLECGKYRLAPKWMKEQDRVQNHSVDQLVEAPTDTRKTMAA